MDDLVVQLNAPENSIHSLDDILNAPGCGTDIDSLDQINQHEGCSEDLEDLDDVTGLLRSYYEPHGKHICELDAAKPPKKNDWLLVTAGKDQELSSFKTSYETLEGRVCEDVLSALGLKTMAYASKYDYSLASHDHNTLYSKVEWISPLERSSYDEIGKIKVVSANGHVALDSIQAPYIEAPRPPEPMIGTFKFIASTSRMAAINGYPFADSMSIYDSNGKVKDTFDGWVWADGAEYQNIDKQLSDAAQVFAGSPTANKFNVPNFSGYFKANPKTNTQYYDSSSGFVESSAAVGIPNHTHLASMTVAADLSIDKDLTQFANKADWNDGGSGPSSKDKTLGNNGFHKGWIPLPNGDKFGKGTASVDASKLVFPGISLETVETGSYTGDTFVPASYPSEPQLKNNSIPVMVYIGGVASKYFERPYVSYTETWEDPSAPPPPEPEPDPNLPELCIEDGVFISADMKQATSIVIPAEVVKLGDQCFWGKSKNWKNNNTATLTSIQFEEGSQLTSIGYRSFYHLYGISSLVIPHAVTTVSAEAFSYCYSLQSVKFESGGTSGSSLQLGDDVFRGCTLLESITIPSNRILKDIPNGAFIDCSSLSSVNLPNTVETIGDDAFYWCINLPSINLPASLTIIGNRVFFRCEKIKSLNTNNVERIGDKAFQECVALSDLTIGSKLTSIGEYAFDGCFSLNSLTIPGTVISIGSHAFERTMNIKEVTLEEGITDIADYMFCNFRDLETISLPTSLTSIGAHSFESDRNPSIEKIQLPENLKNISDFAFNGCTYLTSVNLPTSLTSIGVGAFRKCASIKELDFQKNNALSIGDGVFAFCSSLEKTTNLSSGYTNSGGIIYNSGKTRIVSVLPKKVTKTPSIPNSVTELGRSAFGGCTSMTKVTFSSTNGHQIGIGPLAFESCTSLTNLVNLQKNDVTFLCSGAFIGCTSILSANLSSSTTLTSIGDFAFSGCNSISSINLPEGLKEIYDNAFSGCSSAVEIQLGNSLASIGSSSFYDCCSLTVLIIPQTISEIGYLAFGKCGSCTALGFTAYFKNTTAERIEQLYIDTRDKYDAYGIVWNDYPVEQNYLPLPTS